MNNSTIELFMQRKSVRVFEDKGSTLRIFLKKDPVHKENIQKLE